MGMAGAEARGSGCLVHVRSAEDASRDGGRILCVFGGESGRGRLLGA
jgi:hypothetical protein